VGPERVLKGKEYIPDKTKQHKLTKEKRAAVKKKKFIPKRRERESNESRKGKRFRKKMEEMGGIDSH